MTDDEKAHEEWATNIKTNTWNAAYTQARADTLREVLDTIEWVKDNGGNLFCCWCMKYKDKGHAEDCEVAALAAERDRKGRDGQRRYHPVFGPGHLDGDVGCVGMDRKDFGEDVMTCGMDGCGRVAHYVGRRKHYCEKHREEAAKEMMGKRISFHRDPKTLSPTILKPRRVK